MLPVVDWGVAALSCEVVVAALVVMLVVAVVALSVEIVA